MEKVKITFLGTGDGIPSRKRNHTGILVSFKGENILVDCGEGTQRQFKFTNNSIMKLTKILISHKHGDHIFGIPGLFETLDFQEYSKILKIYGPHGIKRVVQLTEELNGKLKFKFEVHEVSGKFVDEKDFYIQSAEMHHGMPDNAYSIILKDKVRLNKAKLKKLKIPNTPLIKELLKEKDIVVNGKKIRAKDVCYIEKGKKITFVMDTAENPNIVPFALNSDLLVIESSFMEKDSERARQYFHLTARKAAELAKKARVKKLVLTHISQRYESHLNDVLKEAKKVFKNAHLAKDFDVLVV